MEDSRRLLFAHYHRRVGRRTRYLLYRRIATVWDVGKTPVPVGYRHLTTVE